MARSKPIVVEVRRIRAARARESRFPLGFLRRRQEDCPDHLQARRAPAAARCPDCRGNGE